MSGMMKAARIHKYGEPLRLEQIPIPEPNDHQLLIAIVASGVCHTDLHATAGDMPGNPKLPFIPGHEIVGRVASRGRSVTNFKEGDLVESDICAIFGQHGFAKPAGWCSNNGIDDDPIGDDLLPERFAVSQNYPNPFNNSTTISFSIVEPGDYLFKVYNVLGQVVYTQELRDVGAGTHQLSLSDDVLGNLSSGVYFYQIANEANNDMRKMLLLK